MKTIYKYLIDISRSIRRLLISGIIINRQRSGYIEFSGGHSNDFRLSGKITFIKKVVLILTLLLSTEGSFAQLNSFNVSPDTLITVSFGLNRTYLYNQPFDSWTTANYNVKEKNNLTGFIDVGGIFNKHFDLGVNISFDYDYDFYLVYFGRKLTSPQSFVSSWLHLDVGEFAGYFSNVVPFDYVLPPEGQGKKSELQYHAAYIGLTSKNYLNFLHWNVKLGQTKIPFNVGFYASVGITPFNRNWKYGYYENDTTYVGKPIHSIPKLSKVFIKTGVFVGF